MYSHNERLVETELFAQIARGNEKAFAQLMYEFSDVLGVYIFRLTHSREMAEEIVQDVFLKIWQNRESLPNVGNIKAWLFVVSRNRAISVLRKVINERLNYAKMVNSLTLVEGDDDMEERYKAMENAIESLPPQQKRAYILNRREGFSYNEVAKQMGLSKETVKKHLQHATHFIASKVKQTTIAGWLICFMKIFF